MYYTYIVECNDNTLYTGYTTNIKKRILVHNLGKGAKYTRGRTPVVLKYYEEFDRKEDALKRECSIKKLTKKEKLKLIDTFEDLNVTQE
ncbi:GIY-YIG nuclease family protein [Sedimentibacter sp. zth1]|uniref:GIY-YIG nuclease family protein n=1 Tax=Sedimentibacter sp. zth1 TaxID=2816908 RepID=UPI001A934D3D|nr:GIY-YIG nuclease family protein [Sedimentibacter sp. zth1]QSX05299.1 GIY-YIG nuclease family protein [Sedimentibacter sp. zth1]